MTGKFICCLYPQTFSSNEESRTLKLRPQADALCMSMCMCVCFAAVLNSKFYCIVQCVKIYESSVIHVWVACTPLSKPSCHIHLGQWSHMHAQAPSLSLQSAFAKSPSRMKSSESEVHLRRAAALTFPPLSVSRIWWHPVSVLELWHTN